MVFGRKGVGTPPPKDKAVEEQLTVIRGCEDLLEDLDSQVGGLHDMRAPFASVWPDDLNLSAVERGLDDARGALNIYKQRIGATRAALPAESMQSLCEIFQMLNNSVDRIQNYVVQMTTAQAMRNTGMRA